MKSQEVKVNNRVVFFNLSEWSNPDSQAVVRSSAFHGHSGRPCAVGAAFAPSGYFSIICRDKCVGCTEGFCGHQLDHADHA